MSSLNLYLKVEEGSQDLVELSFPPEMQCSSKDHFNFFPSVPMLDNSHLNTRLALFA